MQKDKVNKIYRNLEKALLEETCTYEEAKLATDKLIETYFNRKAGDFLKNATLQEIASTRDRYAAVKR